MSESDVGVVTPLERSLSVVSSLTVLLSCVAAANDLIHLFANSAPFGLPASTLPPAVSVVVFYVVLLLLVFSCLMFFCQANFALLLLSPIVVFAIYWFGLVTRAYLFSALWGKIDFNAFQVLKSSPVNPFETAPASGVHGAVCDTLSSTDLGVWTFLSLYQSNVMTLLLAAAVLLVVYRLIVRTQLGSRQALAATAIIIVVAALFHSFLTQAFRQNPFGDLGVSSIATPYWATVTLYAHEPDTKVQFWKRGCD